MNYICTYVRTYTHTELVILYTARTDGAPDVRSLWASEACIELTCTYIHWWSYHLKQTLTMCVVVGHVKCVVVGGASKVRGGGWVM